MGVGFRCHSEEPAGDEESTQYRGCEDPSTSLRFAQDDTGSRGRRFP